MPPPPYLNAFRLVNRGRTTSISRSIHTNGATNRQGTEVNRATNYRYPFPSIPRPQRNPFYYYNPVASLKRGLSSIPNSKPISFVVRRSYGIRRFSFKGLRRNGNEVRGSEGYGTFGNIWRGQRRFNSSSSLNRRRRIFFRWWTVPAFSVILWAAWSRKRRIEEGEEQQAGKPAKPWQVAAYSTLPLKAMSRLWGKFNDITLPVWMRAPGFKLYSYVFGVNLDEVAENDLNHYANLGEFFYRELKPGCRPIDPNSLLVSPADGKVLHLGVINDNQVEQVKGITYSLDALLGSSGTTLAAPSHEVDFDLHDPKEVLQRHKEFAVVNGISYTLDDLIGGKTGKGKVENQGDATVDNNGSASFDSVVSVSKDVIGPDFTSSKDKELFFTVIYLAPGDYHRFHSPANWVAELRRHFVGELYSVAPYFQKRLQGLFCLNERVALLGRWKYGFFSMTPVGATNVGSIRVHFDKDLRTNTIYELPSSSISSTSISSQESTESENSVIKKRVQNATCYEATYAKASRLLGGYPLTKGEQMGGFNLGSTVVLVFEAPKSFQFNVKAGDLVKVGQSLGDIH